MSKIKEIQIGSTIYDIRDANTLRSLTIEQAIHLDDELAEAAGTTADGLYNGEAVKDGEIFTSADGSFKEFSDTILPPAVTWSDVGTYYMAITTNENGTMGALTSSDGVTVYTTTDGSTLTTLPTLTRSYATSRINAQILSFGDGCLYLAENERISSTSNSTHLYRYDFTTQEWADKGSLNGPLNGFACGVINGDEILIIRYGSTVNSSIDKGVTWNTMTGSPGNYQPIKFIGGKFLTSNGFSDLRYTTNATEWTASASLSGYQVMDYCYDGEKYVAILSNTKIATSPDLSTSWTIITPTGVVISTPAGQSKIGCNGGVYVILTKGYSTPFISTSLTDWTTSTSLPEISQGYNTNPIVWFANNKFRFLEYYGTSHTYEGVYAIQHEYALTDLSYNKTAVDTLVGGVLPSQTGQGGKFLTTNGTNASWDSLPSDLPSQTGQSGKFLTTNGTTASWEEITTSESVEDLTDVDLTSVSNGQVLIYDSSDSKWKNGTLTGVSFTKITETLYSASWNNKSYTLTVPGVTNDSMIWIQPSYSASGNNELEYGVSNIRGASQSTDTIVFACTETPTRNVDIDIIIS